MVARAAGPQLRRGAPRRVAFVPMDHILDPGRRCTDLPWLAEFGFDHDGTVPAAGITPLLATAMRRLGPRAELARALDGGEALGVDMVHAAVNELLAQHALPQHATLSVAGHASGGLTAAVVAGALRALRGHGLPVVVPVAATGACEQVGLCLVGAPLSVPRIAAVGDVVLALRSTGPTDGDFAFLSRTAQQRGLDPTQRLPNGDRVGQALLAPRASHCSVMHEGLRQGWHFTGCAVEGPLAMALARVLPADAEVAWDFAAWRPPSPFDAWFDGASMHAAAAHASVGVSFLMVVAAVDAERWSAHFAAWGEPATALGHVVAARGR